MKQSGAVLFLRFSTLGSYSSEWLASGSGEEFSVGGEEEAGWDSTVFSNGLSLAGARRNSSGTSSSGSFFL